MSDLAGAASPSSASKKEARRLPLLVVTIVGGVVGGLVAAISFAAWGTGLLGTIGGLVVGLLLAWVLPLFLSVRASLALKRQRRPVLLRRLVALVLVGLIQLTVFTVGFSGLGQGTVTPAGELAAAALPLLGPVPVVGGMLHQVASEGGVVDVSPATPAGSPTSPDPSTPGPTGTPPQATPTTTVPALSARAGGRPIGTIAAVATTTDGDLVALRWQLAFGGQTTLSVNSLTTFAAVGAPTRVESSSDGYLAVVLAGQQLLQMAPGKDAVAVTALSRGAKVGELEIQTLRDVAIGPGGTLLVALDAFDANKSAVVQALVASPGDGTAFLVRRGGTAVDNDGAHDGKEHNTTHGYSIKNNDGSGAVVVEEVMLAGADDVGMKLDGAQFVMNPRRLLVGRVDAPRALSELTRTGEDPSGVDNVRLQGFADAVALPDGRVIFDANFAEDGPRGWLFQARLGASVFAVAPELVGKPEAPFGDKAPRTPHLSVEPEGGFAFVNRDGAVVVGTLQRLGEAKVSMLRADALASGVAVGSVARVNTPRLAAGGEWLLARVDVLDTASQRREALVLASTADLLAGKVEVLAIEGAAVPQAVTTTPTTSTTTTRIKSLFVLEGHDEPLWAQP